MKETFVNCLILLEIICSKKSFGQSLITEVTGLETTWAFSGSFNTMLYKPSKITLSNTSRISADYLVNDEVKMLINTNLGYLITPKLKFNIGGKYTNITGMKPSVGLQYSVNGKHIQWMLFPSYVISKQPELITATMIQYMWDISKKFKYVLRMQSLSMICGDGHRISALRFRGGLICGKYQFGVASDVSLSGNDFAVAKSVGLFLQYRIL